MTVLNIDKHIYSPIYKSYQQKIKFCLNSRLNRIYLFYIKLTSPQSSQTLLNTWFGILKTYLQVN